MGTPILFTNIPAFSGALPALMMPSVITEFLLTNGLLWENCIPFMREPNLEIKKIRIHVLEMIKKLNHPYPDMNRITTCRILQKLIMLYINPIIIH